MHYTVSEVLQFVEENDVKFIRLAFCDLFGVQKNVAIMPSELPRAFEKGISFDASAIDGFLNVEESDLFLVPDPATLSILPWRPAQGRVLRFFCDIRRPDGKDFEGDCRQILKRVSARAATEGYSFRIGPECEFYLFKTDEEGEPTLLPYDHAGYCDIAPLDKGENVRREICLTLEEMGIFPESSHHERGPGQNEIDFGYSDPLSAADNVVSFRSVVKAVAAGSGLYASFLPKPFVDQSGSGLHINLSLVQGGVNLFGGAPGEHAPQAESFMQGILRRIPEITAFLNPLPSSYRRFGAFEAPLYVTWSRQNRSQLIRVPAAQGERCRMELRSPDPCCNPYLAFSLVLAAGMEGVQERLALDPPVDRDLYRTAKEELSGIERLPASLDEALDRAQESGFVREILGEGLLRKYIAAKREESRKIGQAEDPRVREMEHDFRRF